MRYIFDLDGTLCSKELDYLLAQPIQQRIEQVNRLYKEGHDITIFTARGMNTFDGDVKKCYDTYYNLTRDQLVAFGVKFDRLVLGKPAYDLWVDDLAVNDEDFFKGVE